jgi:CRP-like cAMP-binding protein
MKRILFILGLLEDEDVDWLVTAGQRREFSTGDVLIEEGEVTQALHLILSGQLVVSVHRSQTTNIAYLGSGEVVGEMSFIDHLPASATVSAAEDTVLLSVHQSVLSTKLAQDMGFSSRFYRALAMLLSTRLRSTVQHLRSEYWQPLGPEDVTCSPEMNDHMTLGSIRFDWLMRRLRDVDRVP